MESKIQRSTGGSLNPTALKSHLPAPSNSKCSLPAQRDGLTIQPMTDDIPDAPCHHAMLSIRIPWSVGLTRPFTLLQTSHHRSLGGPSPVPRHVRRCLSSGRRKPARMVVGLPIADPVRCSTLPGSGPRRGRGRSVSALRQRSPRARQKQRPTLVREGTPAHAAPRKMPS